MSGEGGRTKIADTDAEDIRAANDLVDMVERDGLLLGPSQDQADIVRERLVSVPAGQSVAMANWWLMARNVRKELFGQGLSTGHSWEILVDLYAAEGRSENVLVKGVSSGTGIPHSTALRWINALERNGLIRRRKDPRDARRTRLILSSKGRGLMARYMDLLASRCPCGEIRRNS
jgi:DNA-binding MarR family transcriptional regulator